MTKSWLARIISDTSEVLKALEIAETKNEVNNTEDDDDDDVTRIVSHQDSAVCVLTVRWNQEPFLAIILLAEISEICVFYQSSPDQA